MCAWKKYSTHRYFQSDRANASVKSARTLLGLRGGEGVTNFILPICRKQT